MVEMKAINMSLFRIGLLVIVAATVSIGISGQTKQRIRLSNTRGEAGPGVAGKVHTTITGSTVKEYTFSIPRPKGADIYMTTHSGDPVMFSVISPSGKAIYTDLGDLLDELPETGTYTIRVYRLKDGDDPKGTSKFTLTIFMYK